MLLVPPAPLPCHIGSRLFPSPAWGVVLNLFVSLDVAAALHHLAAATLSFVELALAPPPSTRSTFLPARTSSPARTHPEHPAPMTITWRIGGSEPLHREFRCPSHVPPMCRFALHKVVRRRNGTTSGIPCGGGRMDREKPRLLVSHPGHRVHFSHSRRSRSSHQRHRTSSRAPSLIAVVKAAKPHRESPAPCLIPCLTYT